jgi:uncharacterized protein YpmB
MFEKHKYKILATVLILILLGAGTFYYLKKKREKKEAEEKAALEAAAKKEIEDKDSTKEVPEPNTTTVTAPKKGLEVDDPNAAHKPV